MRHSATSAGIYFSPLCLPLLAGRASPNQIVKERAHEPRLNTYERRYGSRVDMVFLGKVDIPAEDMDSRF